MRVTTYTAYTFSDRSSLIARLMLVLTLVQGTSASLSLVLLLSPALQPLITLAWFGMYFIAFFGLMLTQGMNWIFWILRYRLLLAVLMIGTMASVFWSIDQNVSFERTVHLLGSTLVAIYIGFMIPLVTIQRIMAWVWGAIMLLSIAAALVMPDVGIENYEGTLVWRGILASKNTLGFWSAVGVLLYLSFLNQPLSLFGKFVAVVFAALSFGTLFMSHSATSLLALIVGGSVAMYFFVSIRFQLGFFRMLVLAIMFTAVLALIFLNINTADLVGRSGDLTGRGEVWAQTWKLILQRPATGFGYGTIWNPNDQTIWIQQKLTDFTWVVYHAHNGFLQVASEVGLPLAGVALLMVVQQLIEIFYCQYQRQQAGVLFVLGFVLAYLLSNYAEARFLVNRELYWILFIALPISMLRQIDITIPMMAEPPEEDEGGHFHVDQATRQDSRAAPEPRDNADQTYTSFDDLGEYDPYELTGDFSASVSSKNTLDDIDFSSDDDNQVDILLGKGKKGKPDQ